VGTNTDDYVVICTNLTLFMIVDWCSRSRSSQRHEEGHKYKGSHNVEVSRYSNNSSPAQHAGPRGSPYESQARAMRRNPSRNSCPTIKFEIESILSASGE